MNGQWRCHNQEVLVVGRVVLSLPQTGPGLHVVGGGFLQLYSRMWCAC